MLAWRHFRSGAELPQSTFLSLTYMPFIFIEIWVAIRKLNKYILYAEWLSNSMQATQNFKRNEWNEMYKWKDDTNLSWYVPRANVDHTCKWVWTRNFYEHLSSLGHHTKGCAGTYMEYHINWNGPALHWKLFWKNQTTTAFIPLSCLEMPLCLRNSTYHNQACNIKDITTHATGRFVMSNMWPQVS